MGDFLGFTFGGVHSLDLGITRVSGGDRYDEQLHPEIKDRTAEVPGLNGEYYFGSDFGPRSFDIEIAFDHLTEVQFRKLRRVFGTKRIQSLVFDEHPYKKYMAKLESPVELSYVCFDEPIKVNTTIEGIRYKTDNGYDNTHVVKRSNGGKQRIYKGEGKVSFICHYPFAKSNFKVLPEEGNEYYEGSEEWAISSGILSAETRRANGIDTYNAGAIKIYNPGDVETGFRLYIPSAALGNQITLQYGDAQLVIDSIKLKEYAAPTYTIVENPSGNPKDKNWYELSNNTYIATKDTEVNNETIYYEKHQYFDEGVIVDTNTGLITGIIPSTMTIVKIIEVEGEPVKTEVTEVNEAIHIDYNGNAFYTTSGNIYNQFVNSGYFFKFEPTDFITYDDLPVLQITGASEGIQIFYDYLYF